MGFLRPTSGRATVNDLDCFTESVQVRQRVAYLPGDARLFARMRGRDVLHFFRSMRNGESHVDGSSIAERLDLNVSRRVAFMSTGMRQKLALTVALAADTPLLILDEPTSSLDPTVRREVLKIVREARDRGRTIMLSSHILSEVEEVCDRVIILRAGEVVHDQVMEQLRLQHQVTAVLRNGTPEIPVTLRKHVECSVDDQRRLTLRTTGDLAPVLPWLSSLDLSDVRIEPIGLRSVYERFHLMADT
jgi:ABC-2 type transport system ATP-binding protein